MSLFFTSPYFILGFFYLFNFLEKLDHKLADDFVNANGQCCGTDNLMTECLVFPKAKDR